VPDKILTDRNYVDEIVRLICVSKFLQKKLKAIVSDRTDASKPYANIYLQVRPYVRQLVENASKRKEETDPRERSRQGSQWRNNIGRPTGYCGYSAAFFCWLTNDIDGEDAVNFYNLVKLEHEQPAEFVAFRDRLTEFEVPPEETTSLGNNNAASRNSSGQSTLPPVLERQRSDFDGYVDEILEDYECHQLDTQVRDAIKISEKGHILLTGGPGMGKTSILASLSRSLPESIACFSYFFRSGVGDKNDSRPTGCFQYLIGCLLAHYNNKALQELRGAAPNLETFQGILKVLEDDGTFSVNAPLAFVIDALDEIDLSFSTQKPKANPLEFTSRLPDGVFIIQSTRYALSNRDVERLGRGAIVLQLGTAEEHFEHQRNTAKRYVERVCRSRPEILPYHLSGITTDEREKFVDSLCRSSGYNFMILKFLLYAPDNWTEQGPKHGVSSSLNDQYDRYFERMKNYKLGLVNEAGGAHYNAICWEALDSFAYLENMSEPIFLCVLGGDWHCNSTNPASQPVTDWHRQGLIRKSILHDVGVLSLFHRTFREYVSSRMESGVNLNLHLAPLIQNMLRSLGEEKDLNRLESLSTFVIVDWLKVIITLAVKAQDMHTLSEVLCNINTWRMASIDRDSLRAVLSPLATVKPKPREFSVVERQMIKVAQHLKVWTDEKKLQLGDGTMVTLEMIHIESTGLFTNNVERGVLFFQDIVGDIIYG